MNCCNGWKATLVELDFPSEEIASNLLPQLALGFSAQALHPKGQKKSILGLIFSINSRGDALLFDKDGSALVVAAAKIAASPHHSAAMLLCSIMQRVISITVRFARSAIPLC
ncbi:hypothetical protein PCANC_28477 [Puccinia coronata f. sp. avenae]|uniref:Uncharacterized protein n=1 Tax=Puccinia coronata f. sp. avenae TaxID=200324 RepID=A0A2N5S3L7_9BASI|nr:hypothetical protein PCANC_28477 [Puccinia coronata f. sp. avenae]